MPVSKTIQNGVLDCMFQCVGTMYQKKLNQQKVIQADESIDKSKTNQLVLIYHYIVECKGINETVEGFLVLKNQ